MESYDANHQVRGRYCGCEVPPDDAQVLQFCKERQIKNSKNVLEG